VSGLLTIGRFAEITGLTARALRLYDRLGLLRPTVVDLDSGYRYYSPDQVAVARGLVAPYWQGREARERQAVVG